MRVRTFCTLVCLISATLAAGPSVAQDAENGANAVVVGKILKVDHEILKQKPAILRVTATGEVPTGGYKDEQLARVQYFTPPDDGIQDYYLTALKPTGPATTMISTVQATNEWVDFEREAPWLKGIRVHGVGDGVKLVRFDSKGEEPLSDSDVVLAHKTLYFAPAIRGAHRFEVKGSIKGSQGKGTLVIDRNDCALNEFGDRTICTEAFHPPIPVRFSGLRLADPAMQGRAVYSIDGQDLPEEFKFFLVIGHRTRPQVYRLVVEADDSRSAFPLVPGKEYDSVGQGQ